MTASSNPRGGADRQMRLHRATARLDALCIIQTRSKKSTVVQYIRIVVYITQSSKALLDVPPESHPSGHVFRARSCRKVYRSEIALVEDTDLILLQSSCCSMYDTSIMKQDQIPLVPVR